MKRDAACLDECVSAVSEWPVGGCEGCQLVLAVLAPISCALASQSLNTDSAISVHTQALTHHLLGRSPILSLPAAATPSQQQMGLGGSARLSCMCTSCTYGDKHAQGITVGRCTMSTRSAIINTSNIRHNDK